MDLWLNKKKIYYILRLNKDTKIKPKYQKYQSLNSLKIKPGARIIHRRALVTEENTKDRFNVVICWKKKKYTEPWYLITNLENPNAVIQIYSQRMGIEAMFRDCKSGGYNLEGTKANEQRLTNLILLIALAYTASCLKGLKIRKTGCQEYINRLKDKSAKYSRHSYFFTGLHGSTWCGGMDMYWDKVEKLMRTAPNKLPFYQKAHRLRRGLLGLRSEQAGLRAMKLIQRAL